MPTYVFSYRNPKGYVATAETRAEWLAWFEGMGDALVDMGLPVGARATVGTCDAVATELGGCSLIDVPDMPAALAIAGGCPFLPRGGGVEVGELLPLTAPTAAVGTGS